jgi:hypothetical protein
MQELNDVKTEHKELFSVADGELKLAVVERDEARSEIHALRARVTELLSAVQLREHRPVVIIPDAFDELADWADQNLGSEVELLPRAVQAAKKSVFDDPPLAYQALLLIRDAYVPMRRNGSLPMKSAGKQACGVWGWSARLRTPDPVPVNFRVSTL